MRALGEWAFWRGRFWVGSPPSFPNSLAALIPGSLGAGRPPPPRPWGRGNEAVSAEAEATQMRKWRPPGTISVHRNGIRA